MNIVLAIEPSGGGSGRHVLELAPALVERGHRVHVVYSPLRAEAAFVEQLFATEGLSRHPISMRRAPHPSDLVALLRLRRYLRGVGGVDVIHGHSSKAGALVRLTRFIEPAGVRIYTPHAFRTMDPTLPRRSRLLYGTIERLLTQWGCDALIAVSPDERDHALTLGIPPTKLHVVVNATPRLPPVDREAVRRRLGLGPDDVCVGYVGRFVHQKAPERMVDAVARAAPRCPQLKLVMVGDGELDSRVREGISRLLPEGRAILVGNEIGPAVMPAFDVFVMPSRYEAMPYVLLEALALGLPIVATDVGGASAVIEQEQSGFIVEEGDGEALADRIVRLVTNPSLREAMRAAASRRRSEFDPGKMVERTLDVYTAALAVRRSGLAVA